MPVCGQCPLSLGYLVIVNVIVNNIYFYLNRVGRLSGSNCFT
uniref:Uncharacterized protein n=1 Tax=Anguilla anguilla TaxID=7936 RepID=A0A0E9SXS7_ANGAN